MKRSISRMITLSLAAAFLLTATTSAMAWGPWHSNMTQEQYAKAQQLAVENDAVINPLAQQIYAKQAELNALAYSQNPDSAKMNALAKEIGELQGRMQAQRASMNAKFAKEGFPAGNNAWCNGMGYQMNGRGYGGMGMRHHGGHGGNHW